MIYLYGKEPFLLQGQIPGCSKTLNICQMPHLSPSKEHLDGDMLCISKYRVREAKKKKKFLRCSIWLQLWLFGVMEAFLFCQSCLLSETACCKTAGGVACSGPTICLYQYFLQRIQVHQSCPTWPAGLLCGNLLNSCWHSTSNKLHKMLRYTACFNTVTSRCCNWLFGSISALIQMNSSLATYKEISRLACFACWILLLSCQAV